MKRPEDININVGPQYQAEARTADENKTTELEELHEIDVQGTRPGDELQAVLEETENININGGPRTRQRQGQKRKTKQPNWKNQVRNIQGTNSKRPCQNGQRLKTASGLTSVLPSIPQQWNKK